MLKEHAKLLLFLKKAGRVTGRKKLQKMIFISKKFNLDFQERFNFHFYGPYSEELHLRIEELSNIGFIEEQKEDKGNYLQYTYQLSEKGEEYLELFPTELPALDQFVELLNTQSSRFLELVSTLLYFDKMEREEQIAKVQKVKSKQNYTTEEIESALAYIAKLREVELLSTQH